MAHSGSTAKLQYFEESGGWSDRKPSHVTAPVLKNVQICNIDLLHSDVTDVDRVIGNLAANLPTVALLHNVTPAALSRIKGSQPTRKMYSIFETSRAEMHDESTVVLLRLGLHADPTEASMKPDSKNMVRSLIQVWVPNTDGPSLFITVLTVERNVPQQKRLTVANTILKQVSNADVSMVVSNVMEGIGHDGDVFREIQKTCSENGFVDSIEECLEKNMTTPWVLWSRSAKYAPSTPSAELLKLNEPRYLSCTIVPRPAGAASSSTPGAIAIPMPRSAKSARAKSPNSGAASTTNQPTGTTANPPAQPLLTDPAILSAEVAKGSGGSVQTPSSQAGGTPSPQGTSSILTRLARQQQQQQQQQQAKQQKWQLIHSFKVKGSDAKLSTAEEHFDLTRLFSQPEEAIHAFDRGLFKWPADYCIIGNTVLCSLDIPHFDRQSFRRYARDAKNNTALQAQMFEAYNAYNAATRAAAKANNSTNGAGSAAAASGAAAGSQSVSSPPPAANPTPTSAQPGAAVAEKPNAWSKPMRAEAEEYTGTFVRTAKREDPNSRREWHESWCTIVYQLTPREFKFNITQVVGLGKDNLKQAVYLLNRARSGVKDANNPLQDYPFDYALLFSVERQGYWLMAATHVPCDIVACRMTA